MLTLGVIVAVVSLLVVAWYFGSNLQKKWVKTMMDVAESLGLSYLYPDDVRIPRTISGSWKGVPSTFHYSTRPQREYDPPSETIQLTIETICAKEFGIECLGGPLGVHQYIIRGDSDAEQLLMSDQRCKELLGKAVYDTVTLKAGMLTLHFKQFNGVIDSFQQGDVARFQSIVQEQWELLVTIRSLLIPVPGVTKIASELEGRCPFCRDEIGTSVCVECSNCKAVHHETCWNMNGRCSAMGCRGVALPVVVTSS